QPLNVLPTLFFSADSQLLAGYSGPKEFAVWETATGKLRQRIALTELGGVQGGAIAPDGRTVALEQGNGLVSLVELATGKVRLTYGSKPTPKSPAADERVVASRVLEPIAWFSGLPAATAAFSPDRRLLACRGAGGVLEVFDAATGAVLAKFEGHQGTIAALAFSPDGRRLASGSVDTTA